MVYGDFLCSFLNEVITLIHEKVLVVQPNVGSQDLRNKGPGFKPGGVQAKLLPASPPLPLMSLTLGGFFHPTSCQVGSAVVCFKRKRKKKKENHHHHWMEPFLPWMNFISLVTSQGQVCIILDHHTIWEITEGKKMVKLVGSLQFFLILIN